MPALLANFWSLGLLAVAAKAYTRRTPALYWSSLVLFTAAACCATWLVWAPHSAALAALVLAVLLGPGLLGYALYLLDRRLACFTTEMTYATLAASVLWPLLVLVNFAGTLLGPA
jgi:hypothetical protein